jgi:TldD protein
MLLEESLVKSTLGAALRRGGDFAEVFVEDRRSSSAHLDDGKVDNVTSGRDRGAGVRVVVGDATGFAHTADLTEAGLTKAAETAAAAARAGGGAVAPVVPEARQAMQRLRRQDVAAPYDIVIAPADIPRQRKVELLQRADAAARATGPAVGQVMAVYRENRRRIQVANSDGLLTGDDVTRTLFGVQVVATGDTGMQTGYDSAAGTIGFELFDQLDVEDLARTAANRAITKLSARPAPSGMVPVVIKAGGGAVLFHEACGHGFEADAIEKGASVFAGRVGEQVASPLVTLVDDGTMAAQWGAAAIDDEGRPSQRNVLMENGVITDFMWDFLRARKKGRLSSGNGRRETYQHLPMVRMTNTYVLGGEDDPDELIAQTPHGVYLARLGGGQVNTATGDFVFGTTETYLIENGRITEPLRDANLVGNGPQVLKDIDAVAHDFAMAKGGGTCGKNGQGVSVGMGQPTLRVRGITFGGTAGE